VIHSTDIFRLLSFFDVLAAIVFAVSGALAASRKGMDVMGFVWLAVVTGVGGGTMRDVILGVPVFWVSSPSTSLRVLSPPWSCTSSLRWWNHATECCCGSTPLVWHW